MKLFLPWIVVALLLCRPAQAGAARTSLELAGRWNGVVEFGKFKFQMQLRVVPVDNGRRLKVTLNNTEQGIKDMPISALLFNPPAVRIEFDMFGTAFVGRLSEDGNSIVGQLEEGPGGRPVPVTYTKDLQPDPADLPRTYTFQAGEAPDMRGYWGATAAVESGDILPIQLRIGRVANGTFIAMYDSFEQGRTDLPAKSAVWTNSAARLEWEAGELTVTGKLAADNQALVGEWKQGQTVTPIRFARLAQPENALPTSASVTPGAELKGDFRGHWTGTLEIPGGQKMRIGMKFGQLPDHRFSGTLSSVDQGGTEFRLSSVGVTNLTLLAESRVIHGRYRGVMNDTGQEIAGKWEQNGQSMNMVLHREKPKTEPAP